MTHNDSGLSFGGVRQDGNVVLDKDLYLDEHDNVTDDASKARWLLVAAGGTLTGDLVEKYSLKGSDKPTDDGANRVEEEAEVPKKRTPANKSRTPSENK